MEYVKKYANTIEVEKYKKLKKDFSKMLEDEYSKKIEEYKKDNCLDYILNNYHDYNFNNCDHDTMKKMIKKHKNTFNYFIY